MWHCLRSSILSNFHIPITLILFLLSFKGSGQELSLIWPKDSTVHTPDSIEFNWNEKENSQYYQIHIDTNSNFSDTILFSNVTSPHLVTDTLSYSTTYYWRIRSYNGSSYTNWTSFWTLSVHDPLGVQGLKLWYRSDTGITLSNGKVSSWADGSGNGNDLTQGMDSKKPVLNQKMDTLNGYPAVKFDGSNDLLNTPDFSSSLNQPNTIIILARTNSSNTSYWYDGGSGGRNSLRNVSSSDLRVFAGNDLLIGNSISLSNYHIVSVKFDGINSLVRVDRSIEVSGNTGTDPLSRFTLGARYNGLANLNGEVVEVLGYDQGLDSSNIVRSEKYLMDKYAPPVDLGPDSTICNSSFYLSPTRGFYDSLEWSNSSNSDSILVTTSGTYWVKAKDIFGRVSRDTVKVTLSDFSIATLDTFSICTPDTLTWNTQLDTTGYDFLWSDGSTDSLLNITQSDSYYVAVTDTFGCTKYSDTVDVFVSEFPDSASLGPDTSLCSGNEIRLMNGGPASSSYSWSTGETTPYKVVDTSGTYWVDVTDTLGCSASDTIDVNIIGDAPTASFTYESTCYGDSVNFQSTSTAPAGDSIIDHSWNFGDSQTDTLPSPSNLYSDTGNYTVDLTVTLNTGCKATTSRTITVYPLPEVGFSNSQYTCSDYPVTFLDTSDTPYQIDNVDWDFGDPNNAGDTASGSQVEYSYNSPGFYTVKEIVTDSNGCTDSTSASIQILQSPTAYFTFQEACIGDSVTFQDSSVGNIVSRTWFFGDNQSAVDTTNIAHLYQNPTFYYPTLNVTAQNGCFDDTTLQVEIHPEPQPGFDHEPFCVGNSSEVTDTSYLLRDSIISHYWDFGGRDSAFIPNPTVSFEQSGLINVYLEVTTDFGCTNSISKGVVISEPPEVDFDLQPGYGEPPLSPNFLNNSSGSSFYWDMGDGGTSTQEEPSYTFTSKGVYDVQLISTNQYGCQDSLSKKIYVKEPRIDIAISNVHLRPSNDFFEVTAEILNLGPIELDYLELELKTKGAPRFKEIWNGNLAPGERTLHQFSGKLEGSVELSYICVKGVNPDHTTDIDTSNNEACESIGEQFRILSLYPNPAHDRIRLELDLPFAQELTIQIFDRRGRKVRDHRIGDLQKGFNRVNLDLKGLEDGAYTVRVIGEKGVLIEHFLRTRK